MSGVNDHTTVMSELYDHTPDMTTDHDSGNSTINIEVASFSRNLSNDVRYSTY